MDDVIDQCHTTFEEEGVDNKTLEELRGVSLPALSIVPNISHHLEFSILSRFRHRKHPWKQCLEHGDFFRCVVFSWCMDVEMAWEWPICRRPRIFGGSLNF